ncbi:MAG: S-layer homology domain-containing protein [Peptoniphilus sp.]|nr:S-layer homology domain-containing protein [Peptoniphilus sp.]MDY3118002.1 S-layer homology domain-containing protein [Peptoniphilus sp.]
MKQNKAKAVATLALTGALLTTPFAAQAATFKDVPANHWAYSQISKLSDLRIISGYDDGTFKPSRSVSFLEVLTLLKGIQNPSAADMTRAISTKGYISDAYNVPGWAKPAVCIALENNVITEANLKAAYNKHYINNVKNADQFPGRELIMVYYAKALGIQPIKDTSKIRVSDIAEIGYTPKELTGDADIKGLYAAMIEAGIFHGEGTEGKFKPNSPLTRDQMATITNFSYDYVAKTKAIQTFEGDVSLSITVNNVPTFTIKDKVGKTTSFVLAKNTAVTLNGKVATIDAVTEGSTVKVKAFPQTGGVAPYQAVSVDVIGNDASGKGLVYSMKGDEIQIAYSTKKDIIDDTFKPEKTENFKFDKDTVITCLGKKIDKNAIGIRDLLNFKAKNGILKEVEVYPYSGVVNGEFVNFAYTSSGTATITLKLEDNKEHEFVVKDAGVARALFELSQTIKKGYPLTLKTRYQEVTDAKEMEYKIDGIYEQSISSLYGYEISVRTNQGSKKYPLSETMSFIVDGEITKTAIKSGDLPSVLSRYSRAQEVHLELTLKGGKVTEIRVIGVLEKADVSAPVTKIVRLNNVDGKFGYNALPGYTAYEISFTIDNQTETYRLTLADKFVPAVERSRLNDLFVKYDLYSSPSKVNSKNPVNFRLDTSTEKNIQLYRYN